MANQQNRSDRLDSAKTIKIEGKKGGNINVGVPAWRDGQTEEAVFPAPAPPPPQILCVDGSATTRSRTSEWLTAAGYNVDVAIDGKSGLQAATDRPPDLLLLDLILPGLNGVQLVKTLHQRNSERSGGGEIPVIIMSAKGSEVAERLMRALDVTAVLQKPFSAAQLLETIEQALSLHGVWKRRRKRATARSTTVAEPKVLPAGTRLYADLQTIPLVSLLPHIRKDSLARTVPAVVELVTKNAMVSAGVKEGKLLWVQAQGLPEFLSLGHFLVSERLVSAQDLEMHLASSMKKKSPKTPKLGEQLVQLGYIDTQGLRRALERQAIERLLLAVTWPTGHVVVRDGRDPGEAQDGAGDTQREETLEIDLRDIHLLALERAAKAALLAPLVLDGPDEEIGLSTIFHKILGATEKRPTASRAEPLDDVALGAALESLGRQDAAIYSHVNGRNTLKDILRETKLPGVEVAQILVRLQNLGLIRARRPPLLL